MNFLRIIHHNFLRIIRRNDLIVTFTYGNIKKVFNNFNPCEEKSLKFCNCLEKYNVRNHEYK